MSAAGLRDLVRIRYYYPNVIPEEEAKSLHEGFAANLKSAAELCQLERVFEIGKIPTFEEGGSDAELSVVMGVLSVWHPDTKGDPSAPDVAKTMDAAIAKCQEDVTEPVRSMIERVINAMLYDCRVPMPKGDPSYEEPQRFVQMLRSYWGIVRQLVLHHIEAPASFRPHPLMPLVVNLKARIDACFDRLTQLKDVADVRQTVTTLVDVVLSGEPDDLQAAPEWSYDQVTSVDRFIEEGRLALGAKTYPLTPAEEMCLAHAQREVQRYDEQVKGEWSKILRRMDANQKARTRETNASPEKKTPSEPQTNPAETTVSGTEAEPQQFSGGEIVFFEDRVELCGVNICSGTRTKKYRATLELLAKKDRNGAFKAYSCEDLARLVGISPDESDATKREVNAAGHIRHLRRRISSLLQLQANLACGDEVVIRTGKRGYHFTECISVQFVGQSAITDITDIDGSEDVPNVPNDDVRDAFDVPDDAAARRDWILQQLTTGMELKAPMVAEHFNCSVKTAQRDLTTLKDEGKIEYVGAPRTGYYRMCQPPASDP